MAPTHKLNDEIFRLFVERVRDYAIFLVDVKGGVLSWNAGAEALKGYRADEIIGHSFELFYPEEDRLGGKPARLLAQARQYGRVEDEGWRVRKDGSRFWADVVITAVLDDAGHLEAYAKITRDLTERREGELRLEKMAGELADKVTDLERFVEATVGRELKMVELEKDIAALRLAAGTRMKLPIAATL